MCTIAQALLMISPFQQITSDTVVTAIAAGYSVDSTVDRHALAYRDLYVCVCPRENRIKVY